jgi:ATP-dependent DNA ligase
MTKTSLAKITLSGEVAFAVAPGGLWVHEIKHDGFRIIARKDGERVTLYSRPGNDFTRRFPPIARALTNLRCRWCIIDGEAVICDDNGVASFNDADRRQLQRDVQSDILFHL